MNTRFNKNLNNKSTSNIGIVGDKSPNQNKRGIFPYNNVMVYGKRIFELRIEKGLSKTALGKILGVDHSTISAWESCANEIKVGAILKLADYFGVTTDYLLGRVDFK